MPYFKISNTGGNGGGSEPADYTELIQSVRDKGGTVADGASLQEIIIAVATIPDYVEPLDLQPIAQAIRDKGGTVAQGDITALDLVAAITTIPEVRPGTVYPIDPAYRFMFPLPKSDNPNFVIVEWPSANYAERLVIFSGYVSLTDESSLDGLGILFEEGPAEYYTKESGAWEFFQVYGKMILTSVRKENILFSNVPVIDHTTRELVRERDDFYPINYLEPIETDLTGVENQIVAQGGTVTKSGDKPTASEISVGIETIPNDRPCPVPPLYQ
ncbi:hypothetical protein CSV63_07480 [Sporosarcina sp. P34]|uniref:hypothetical protein n=1 Tax=Sporosarcina sp. P34 TaxID=2048247 RepID=UPI000C16513C|nr:hypothetical protein [Sporosarcina sp. P34]PID15610.1 hypothetical protein CSV63_07480 [Sporosarcina sp. P34]